MNKYLSTLSIELTHAYWGPLSDYLPQTVVLESEFHAPWVQEDWTPYPDMQPFPPLATIEEEPEEGGWLHGVAPVGITEEGQSDDNPGT